MRNKVFFGKFGLEEVFLLDLKDLREVFDLVVLFALFEDRGRLIGEIALRK